MVALDSRQSAWAVFSSASLAGFATLVLACKLGQRFPSSTLPEYSEIILGKLIGKIISSGFLLFLLTVNVLSIREFSEFLGLTLSLGTPPIVLNIITVLIAGYSAFQGIEVIARMSQFILPICVAIGVALFAMSSTMMDFPNL